MTEPMTLIIKVSRNLPMSASSSGVAPSRFKPAFCKSVLPILTAPLRANQAMVHTLKSKSIRPYFSFTVANIRPTSSSELTSPTAISVIVPSLHASAVAWSSPSRLPERTRTSFSGWLLEGKALESEMAHWRPIPPEAPVMRMTR